MSAKPRASGFSLIELLIVVAIAAILTTVALPSYRSHIASVNRGAARSALVQAAQWMERVATATGRYPSPAEIPPGLLRVSGDAYRISATGSATAYTLAATPAGSPPTDRCGTLSLLQSGKREITHAALDATVDACWGR